MFGGKKGEIQSDKYKAMYEYTDANDDMPDGAFFAMAEETHGWDAEDWGWFSEVTMLNEKKK